MGQDLAGAVVPERFQLAGGITAEDRRISPADVCSVREKTALGVRFMTLAMASSAVGKCRAIPS
jgi:hypothetical protein